MVLKSIKRNVFSALYGVFLGASCLFASGVQAQNQTASSDWNYVVAPYFWGAGASGTVGLIPGGEPADIDLSFSDIFKGVEPSGMIIGRATNGNWGLTVDAQFINIKQGDDVPGKPGLEVTLESNNKMYTFMGDYKVYNTDAASVWLTAGARYWRVETTLTTNTGGYAFGKNTWWDPILGAHGRYAFDDRNAIVGWATFGGFGVGSDFTMDLFAGYERRFTPVTAMQVGWRHLTVDRTDGDFVYDIYQTGPILGLSFTF